ncbi:MAG: hypothetical protein ACOYMA_13585 [Bacteroidia bacterium]
MKVSEVKTKLLDLLTPFSNEIGYKINKNRFSISKEHNNINATLQFTTNSWFDEVQIMPSVNVNIKEINDIWKMFNEYASITYSMNLNELKDWYDLGVVSWEKFQLNKKDRHQIFNYETDLMHANLEIQYLFNKYGLRYINDFGSIEGVNKLYNQSLDDLKSYHCAGFQVRSVVGLIAAKLSNNPDYIKISEFYTNKINEHKLNDTMTKKDIEIFFKVKAYLG